MSGYNQNNPYGGGGYGQQGYNPYAQPYTGYGNQPPPNQYNNNNNNNSNSTGYNAHGGRYPQQQTGHVPYGYNNGAYPSGAAPYGGHHYQQAHNGGPSQPHGGGRVEMQQVGGASGNHGHDDDDDDDDDNDAGIASSAHTAAHMPPIQPRHVSPQVAPRSSKRHTAKDMFGLTYLQKQSPKDAPEVPHGMEVRHTKKGVPFFAPITEDERDREAQMEHQTEFISVFCSNDELEARYGVGILLYFDFVKYLVKLNLVLLFLALCNWVPHMIIDDLPGFSTDDFFVSTYSRSIYIFWMASNIVAVFCSFVFGPLYSSHITSFFLGRQQEHGDEEEVNEFDGTYLDVIEDNRHVSRGKQGRRLFYSYFLFLVCVGIAGAISFVITRGDWNNRALPSLLSSVVVALSNYMWKQVCTRLTRFECHRTWSSFRKHNTIKFFAFKICNVLVLYVAKRLATEVDREKCVTTEIGQQFLFLILLDVIVFNVIEFIAPQISARIWHDDSKGDEANKPEFDLSEEYLELLSRQFIIYMGMSTFPLITLIGVLAMVMEIYLDKARLIKVCQTPRIRKHSLRHFITFFLMITAIAALASWPNGTGFILSSTRSTTGFAKCTLFPDG